MMSILAKSDEVWRGKRKALQIESDLHALHNGEKELNALNEKEN